MIDFPFQVAKWTWRLIRPHVYSVRDYSALIESDPEDLTMGEILTLDDMARRQV